MLTCKQWYSVAHELLFRNLYFNTPLKLFDVVKILESQKQQGEETSLGWWTRRVHVCRYSSQELQELNIEMEDMQRALVLIIEHCPNLEIFHVDWPMRETFGEVALALAQHSKRSLRTIYFNVPRNALSKVIWTLDSLKYIVAAHIEFEQSSAAHSAFKDEDEDGINLGSAYDYPLDLRYLYQLSIGGHAREFLEQATTWHLPSLKIFSYNTGSYIGAVPDIIGFLDMHGDGLEFLDLDTNLPLEIAKILDRCPQVSTFAFNADCRITPLQNDRESQLTTRPKPNIHTIGLHGLSLAFGVGPVVGAKSATSVALIQRSNDLIMAALNKRNFPNLQRVRALSRPMLMDLNDAGQPNVENGGMARWTNWWDTCARAGIRLEDCTGDSLGNLPELPGPCQGYDDSDDDDSDEYDDEDDDEDDDDDDDEDDDDDDDYDDSDDSSDEGILPPGWKKLIPQIPQEKPSARTQELRDLLKECRAMDRERSREGSMLPPSLLMMMGGGMPGVSPDMMQGFGGQDIPMAIGGMGFGSFGGPSR